MKTDTYSIEDLAVLAKEVRSAADDLIGYLAEAVEIQWDASPVPKPREDTSQRAQGEVSDPTSDVTLDARRLAVREEVQEATKSLSASALNLSLARIRLERSLDRWAGK